MLGDSSADTILDHLGEALLCPYLGLVNLFLSLDEFQTHHAPPFQPNLTSKSPLPFHPSVSRKIGVKRRVAVLPLSGIAEEDPISALTDF